MPRTGAERELGAGFMRCMLWPGIRRRSIDAMPFPALFRRYRTSTGTMVVSLISSMTNDAETSSKGTFAISR